MCDVANAGQLPKAGGRNQVVITIFQDGHVTMTPECNVRATQARPQVTAAMARAEAERLLPHPVIGTAPVGHATLVNIETVLWVATSSDRMLGTVTLLGYRVGLRAHLERVEWRFGDGADAVTTGPGKAYGRDDPCRTVQCPDYFGHTYVRTGVVTISARLTWSGQFQVDGGAWQDIGGTVTAPATDQTVRVRQARGVLVPNP